MNPERFLAIQERMLDVSDRYGKVGLLIDDSHDAGSRVARELYGAEKLPEWWLQARSAECGAHALRVFIAIFDQTENPRRIRGIVLIDRFLPVRDEGGRPAAWDVPKSGIAPEEKKIIGEMKLAVRSLIALGQRKDEERWFEYIFITSYPHLQLELGLEDRDEDPIPWQTRSMEVLFQLRRKLRSALLVYGPEQYFYAAEQDHAPETRSYKKKREARWKSMTWHASIEGLAKALVEAKESTPVVLFTGAGVSLAQGAYGAGMPPTWWLLEEACRTLVHDPRENENPRGRLHERQTGPPPQADYNCCHKEIFERSGAPIAFSGGEDAAPIDWLIDYLLRSKDHRASDLQCRLETIFSREWNRKSIRNSRRFYQYFRSHLERFDHGFPYHHWLLAQMPWTRIITTNFDGFHERAAFAVASDMEADPDARQERLALGSVFPDIAFEGEDAKFADLVRSFRLFKPYGNLLSPAELALGGEQLEDFKERLGLSFRGLEEVERGWLVVIGHAMKDDHISDVLKSLDGKGQLFQRRFELLWVDPEAYRRCALSVREDGTLRSTWETWIHTKMEQRERENVTDCNLHSGPLPGTALEFTYDLWTECQRAFRVRFGGRRT